MNRLNHLLACVSEEAGEIVQAVGKAHRFGLYDGNPNSSNQNITDIFNEMCDLIAVWEMLCDEIGEDKVMDMRAVEDKKLRVEKFIGYAEKVTCKKGQV